MQILHLIFSALKVCIYYFQSIKKYANFFARLKIIFSVVKIMLISIFSSVF